MINSLYPTKAVLTYSSQYAPHVMTIPLRAWIDTTPGDPLGQMNNWIETPIDVETMFDGLITLMAELFLASTNINGVTIWTYADPEADPVFVAGKSYSQAGTSVSPNQAKAVQTTYNMVDTEGEIVKFTLMDAPVDTFERIVGLSALSADEEALLDYFADDAWAFSSRNGARPNLFRSRTTTLNEKLRREYHMT